MLYRVQLLALWVAVNLTKKNCTCSDFMQEERRGEEREGKKRIHNVLLLLLLLLRSSKMGGRKLGGSLTGFKMSAWVCKRELIR